ncbi:hypothetical protein MHA_0506 [Mannheimia haemolytica PHL213]|nr:hypothetical protein MHA_0506 [Mannheimia haemolytica PHL213]
MATIAWPSFFIYIMTKPFTFDLVHKIKLCLQKIVVN